MNSIDKLTSGGELSPENTQNNPEIEVIKDGVNQRIKNGQEIGLRAVQNMPGVLQSPIEDPFKDHGLRLLMERHLNNIRQSQLRGKWAS